MQKRRPIVIFPPPTSFFFRKDAKVRRRKREASCICVSVFGEGRGDRTFLLPNPPPRRPLRRDTIRRRWASLSDRREKSRGRADSPFLILTAIHVFDVCCLMLLLFWSRMSMKCCWKYLCRAVSFNVFQAYKVDNKTQVVSFFYSCTVHSDVIQSFISPTNAQPICFKILKFTLKYTINDPTCFGLTKPSSGSLQSVLR